MKLISMTDFVLDQNSSINSSFPIDYQFSVHDRIYNYANFLKQPLELWMFVPCDSKGDILEEPTETHKVIFNDSDCLKEYHEAKDRVLFEGFSISENNENNVSNGFFEINLNSFCFSKIEENGIVYGVAKNIEQLVEWDIILTESAKKKIGITND